MFLFAESPYKFIMTLKGRCANFIIRFFSAFPIDKKKIVFESFEGKSFNDNPRAIYEQMVISGKDFHYIWLLNDKKKYPIKAKIIRPRSFRALYHLATAQLWVDNFRKNNWVSKRNGQFYVQTWHGGPMIKKIEADVADNLPKIYIESAINDSKMADLFISGSRFETEIYKKSFWYDGNILEEGLPMLSPYYKNPGIYYNKIVREYHAYSGDHFLLYAPTFREDHSMDSYLYDFEMVRKVLEEKYGGVWRVLIRLHPGIQELQDKYSYNEWVLNASNYEEISDLIMASELMISDYSSCMFYAMVARKRVLIYAADIDTYNNDRGTYMKLEELPFLISSSDVELLEKIRLFDDFKYNNLVNDFIDKYRIYSSAESADKVTKYIIEHMYDNC